MHTTFPTYNRISNTIIFPPTPRLRKVHICVQLCRAITKKKVSTLKLAFSVGSIKSNFLGIPQALDASRRMHADFILRFFPKLCQHVRVSEEEASVIPRIRSALNCRTTTEPFNTPTKQSHCVRSPDPRAWAPHAIPSVHLIHRCGTVLFRCYRNCG